MDSSTAIRPTNVLSGETGKPAATQHSGVYNRRTRYGTNEKRCRLSHRGCHITNTGSAVTAPRKHTAAFPLRYNAGVGFCYSTHNKKPTSEKLNAYICLSVYQSLIINLLNFES
jgi:hypothetical protein